MGIHKKDFSPIENTFKASFNNKSYFTKGRNYNHQTRILSAFELFDLNADVIHFHFDTNNKLVLTIKDSLGVKSEAFNGKFKRKGYYEVFIRKYKKEIPPFIPIIYGIRHIKRLRIGLTKENDLVIDYKWEDYGSIFILAGGSGGRYRSHYKQIPTEQ